MKHAKNWQEDSSEKISYKRHFANENEWQKKKNTPSNWQMTNTELRFQMLICWRPISKFMPLLNVSVSTSWKAVLQMTMQIFWHIWIHHNMLITGFCPPPAYAPPPDVGHMLNSLHHLQTFHQAQFTHLLCLLRSLRKLQRTKSTDTAQRQESAAALLPHGCRSLVKVTDVTLDVIQAQHCSLVVVVVVLVLIVRAATQLVLDHLRR